MISDFSLFMFTVLVGLASGAYIAAAVFPQKGIKKRKPWAFPLTMFIMIVVGGIAAFMHLGRPELAYNMVGNLASPLMLEGLASGILAIVALVDIVLSIKKQDHLQVMHIVGAVAGLACLLAMTYAYSVSFGTAAWVSAPTLFVFVATGLAGGFSLWIAFSDRKDKVSILISGILNVVCACVLIWQTTTFMELNAEGGICIGVGAAISTISAVVLFVQPKVKAKAEELLLIAAVLSIVAVVISRYGFYMASII